MRKGVGRNLSQARGFLRALDSDEQAARSNVQDMSILVRGCYVAIVTL